LGWKKNNRERAKLYEKKRTSNHVDNLTDAYMKKRLGQMGVVATAVNIELKRQQIIMKRTLKEFKQWRKGKENESNHADVYGIEQSDEINHEGRLQTRTGISSATGV
jgi:hypothetical protein